VIFENKFFSANFKNLKNRAVATFSTISEKYFKINFFDFFKIFREQNFYSQNFLVQIFTAFSPLFLFKNIFKKRQFFFPQLFLNFYFFKIFC